jgi:putative FmdB family regulatory protein
MPIYEYKCQNCDYQFEQLQKVNDKPLEICPQCHKPKLQKLVSSAGFALKGTGWYVTDFRDNKSEQSAKTETKAEIKNE